MQDHILTLNLVAFYADIRTTFQLMSVNSMIVVREDVNYQIYLILSRHWRVWKQVAQSRPRYRMRLNSWRSTKSKNFDENAPLLIHG